MTDLRTTGGSPQLPAEVDASLVEMVSEHLSSGRREATLEALSSYHPADIAELLHHLAFDDAQRLFGWLPAEEAGEVLPELDEEYRNELLEELRPREITELIDGLDTDDAADVLGDLPQEVVEKVLPQLEDAEEVRELLEYGEETAGGLMEAEYIVVHDDVTVTQATEEVRRLAEEVDPVYAVYVVDAKDRLVGIVPLKRLLLSRANIQVEAIMGTDFVSVDPEMDQEEVALIMDRRDLTVLPVVDSAGHLLGRITIDDVIDVIREEAEEDIQRMVGIAADEDLTDSVFKISRGRLIWLFVGLVGASLSALVINGFEDVIQEAIVLAMFIPVVMAMGGNAGMQSSAIAVQGLATGELWTSDVVKRLGKELAVAVVNGLPLAVILGLGVLAMHRAGILGISDDQALRLSLTVALALLTVIVLAATIGATVPLVLDRFGIDPALAAGPFVTTSNDLLGLIVYFLMATFLYMP